jgi:hypothetical protein
MWVTGGYPWDGDPVGGIFFQTQARALAGLGVSLAVVAPTPVVPWPLTRLRARWQRYAAAPRLARDEGVLVVRPRYLNVPGQPSWALPDRSVAGAVWRSRRHWDGTGVIHGHYAVTGLAAWRGGQAAVLPRSTAMMVVARRASTDEPPAGRGRQAHAVFAVGRARAPRRDVTDVEAVTLPIGSTTPDRGRPCPRPRHAACSACPTTVDRPVRQLSPARRVGAGGDPQLGDQPSVRSSVTVRLDTPPTT